MATLEDQHARLIAIIKIISKWARNGTFPTIARELVQEWLADPYCVPWTYPAYTVAQKLRVITEEEAVDLQANESRFV